MEKEGDKAAEMKECTFAVLPSDVIGAAWRDSSYRVPRDWSDCVYMWRLLPLPPFRFASCNKAQRPQGRRRKEDRAEKTNRQTDARRADRRCKQKEVKTKRGIERLGKLSVAPNTPAKGGGRRSGAPQGRCFFDAARTHSPMR